jgi:hypothetical protein
MRSVLLMLALLIANLALQAQDSDRKVNPDKLPASILPYIDQKYPDHDRVHFYTEKIGDTLYYEAKFEQHEDEYDLLFDVDGNLYETEKTLPEHELKEAIKDSIHTYLKSQFEEYKILKVQEVELKGRLLYELNVKGKKKGNKAYYEIYFDRKGKYVGTEDVILNSIPSMF